jgi:hypothetical protein
MVIPFCAPEVAHLVHQGLQAVVHGLRVLALVDVDGTGCEAVDDGARRRAG